MQRHHTGSGRRTAIHPDWADAPAGIITTTLDATVAIGPATGGPSTWSDAEQQVVATAGDPVYAGAAQVTAVTDNDRPALSAEDPVTVRSYAVTLPVDTAGIEVGHLVRVTVCDDPELQDRRLTVTSIVRGSRRFSRTAFADLLD